MTSLSLVVAQVAGTCNVPRDSVKVFSHEAGVWGNTVYEIDTPSQKFLYMESKSP